MWHESQKYRLCSTLTLHVFLTHNIKILQHNLYMQFIKYYEFSTSTLSSRRPQQDAKFTSSIFLPHASSISWSWFDHYNNIWRNNKTWSFLLRNVYQPHVTCSQLAPGTVISASSHITARYIVHLIWEPVTYKQNKTKRKIKVI